MFSELLDNSSLLFTVSAIVMTTLLVITLIVARSRGRKVITPVTVFFIFMTVHALAGYYLAFTTANQIGRTGAALEFYFNRSLLILSIGVSCIYLGYLLFPSALGATMEEYFVRASQLVTEETMAKRARFFILVSAGLTAGGLAAYGSIPLFQDFAHRYTNVFKPNYGWVAFTVNRGRDLVQLPTAFAILILLRGKQVITNLAFILIAIITCVLTVTRTPLVDILLIVLIVISLRGRTSTLAMGGIFVLVGYLSTQILMVKDPIDSFDRLLGIAGGALPEVRDFANVLQKEPDRFWGLTFLIGILPVPGFFSEFTSAYLIRSVTLNAAGIPLDAPHGGLRITYIGECYINWGLAGVVIGCLLLGMFYAWFSRIFEAAYVVADVRLDFMAASIWMIFSFEIYLSGTGVAGMVKALLVGLLFLIVPLKRRRSLEWIREERTLPLSSQPVAEV